MGPYSDSQLNYAETASLLSSAFLFSISVVYSKVEPPESSKEALSWLALVTVLLFLLGILVTAARGQGKPLLRVGVDPTPIVSSSWTEKCSTGSPTDPCATAQETDLYTDRKKPIASWEPHASAAVDS